MVGVVVFAIRQRGGEVSGERDDHRARASVERKRGVKRARALARDSVLVRRARLNRDRGAVRARASVARARWRFIPPTPPRVPAARWRFFSRVRADPNGRKQLAWAIPVKMAIRASEFPHPRS